LLIGAPVNTELDGEQSLYRCRNLVLPVVRRFRVVAWLTVIAPLAMSLVSLIELVDRLGRHAGVNGEVSLDRSRAT
jgi:hypothetical protein